MSRTCSLFFFTLIYNNVNSIIYVMHLNTIVIHGWRWFYYVISLLTLILGYKAREMRPLLQMTKMTIPKRMNMRTKKMGMERKEKGRKEMKRFGVLYFFLSPL